jgi:uncharacterized membrane protein YccF (DUF307 family)
MRILANLIWLILGGVIIAIMYLIGSIILMITIVGIPFGIQTLKMGTLALWPFGRDSRVQADNIQRGPLMIPLPESRIKFRI